MSYITGFGDAATAPVVDPSKCAVGHVPGYSWMVPATGPGFWQRTAPGQVDKCAPTNVAVDIRDHRPPPIVATGSKSYLPYIILGGAALAAFLLLPKKKKPAPALTTPVPASIKAAP